MTNPSLLLLPPPPLSLPFVDAVVAVALYSTRRAPCPLLLYGRRRRIRPFGRLSLLKPPLFLACLRFLICDAADEGRRILTAASSRLMLGRYYSNDGFLDADRPNDQEASQARRVPAR
jgi:hypothetical protein